MNTVKRLIENFDYDRRRAGTLDDGLREFIEDLTRAVDGVEDDRERYGDQRFSEGYEEGHEDGEASRNDASDIVEDLESLRQQISDMIVMIEK